MSVDLPGYVLHDRVGAGAYATVWRAEREGQPGRVVVVKRLHADPGPDEVATFRREIDALARLSHPSILRLLDVVDDGAHVALILPYAPGGSLADRIARNDRHLTPTAVADIGARIGRALAAAHDAGLLHRDVKPSNILFDAEGQPLLADFGTALLRDRSAPAAGTAEYLDPEVAAGQPATPASDIYGLGVTCYEALAGTPPYAGSSPQATLQAADRGIHLPLAQVGAHLPPVLVTAVEQAMARRPEDRLPTAAALSARLDEARLRLEAHGAGSPAPLIGQARGAPDDPAEDPVERSATRLFGPAPPRRQAPTTPSPRRGNRPLWVTLAIAALLVPILVVWWLTRTEPTTLPMPVLIDTPSPQPETDEPTVLASPARPCQDLEEPAVDGQAATYLADVEGRGCSAVVAWDGRVLTVPRSDGGTLRYDLDAAEDDVLLFGDWSCDGAETPALYRPGTGEAFLFEGFANPGEEITVQGRPTGVVGGVPQVVVDADGCHHLDVQPAGA